MASHMLAGGVPLPAVSARLGHSDMQTTLRIYGHMIHGQDDEAVRKLEEYQQRNRPTRSWAAGPGKPPGHTGQKQQRRFLPGHTPGDEPAAA